MLRENTKETKKHLTPPPAKLRYYIHQKVNSLHGIFCDIWSWAMITSWLELYLPGLSQSSRCAGPEVLPRVIKHVLAGCSCGGATQCCPWHFPSLVSSELELPHFCQEKFQHSWISFQKHQVCASCFRAAQDFFGEVPGQPDVTRLALGEGWTQYPTELPSKTNYSTTLWSFSNRLN